MEISRRLITLQERGDELILTPAQWDLVEDGVRDLCKKGILGLKSASTYKILKPQQFVGRLRTFAAIIEIRARNDQWFAALQQLVAFPGRALPDGKREASSGTAAGFADLAFAFYKTLELVLRNGFPRFRQKEVVVSSAPKGRMMFNDSVRGIFAKGVKHRVVCSRLVARHDQDLASVTYLAAGLALQLPSPLIVQRNLDCLVDMIAEDARQMSLAEANEYVEVLRNKFAEWPEVVSLLQICEAVFKGNQSIWDIDVPLESGEARFCNVDRLWELAILTVGRSVLSAGLSIEFHPYARTSVRLLSEGGPEIDPDIVVFRAGSPAIIVDAKNSFATSPNAPDVYQIICYVERLKAESGVLVYLSPSENWMEVLGRTNSGQKIIAIGVSTTNTIASLSTAMAKIFPS